MFKALGAPLKNTRWSWGALNPNTGAVYLRVWIDDVRERQQGKIVRLTNRAYFEGGKSLGYAERKRHLERLQGGVPGYLIFCRSREPSVNRRKMKSFVADQIFPTGAMEEVEGDTYIQFAEGIAITGVPKR